MRKVSDYEQHAAECRVMASKTQNPTYRQQLEDMAEAWAMLARERRKQLLRQAEEQAFVGHSQRDLNAGIAKPGVLSTKIAEDA